MKSLVEMKALFFDREAVLNALTKAEIKVLSKFGAFVRRSARSSIKKSSNKRRLNLYLKLKDEKNPKKRAKLEAQLQKARESAISKPGQPPKGHAQQLLKQGIQFAADTSKRSIVVGPVKLNKPGEVTSALEYGGPVVIKEWRKSKRVRIKARPFMRPAFKVNQPKLSQLWADSVK